VLDGVAYHKILQYEMFPSARKLFGAEWQNMKILQDNDPKHTSKTNMAYLENQNIEVLNFPSYSPDMNPIENLWNELNVMTKHRKCKNEKELFQLLKQAWNTIAKKKLHDLVKSMPRRLNAVIKAKGAPTKY
jgi:hypothetical protein